MTEIIEIVLCGAGMIIGGAITGAALMDQHHRRLLAAREAERRHADERMARLEALARERETDLVNAQGRLADMQRAQEAADSYAQGVETGMQIGANTSAASEFLRVIEGGGKGAAFMRRSRVR